MRAFAVWLRETPIRPWRGQTTRSIYGVHGALKDLRIFVRWMVEEEYLAGAGWSRWRIVGATASAGC